MYKCLECNVVSSEKEWQAKTVVQWGEDISNISEEWDCDYFTCPNCENDDSGNIEKIEED